MAITYHAGRRIQGTSTAVTNWVEASGTNGTGAGQYDSSNTSGDNSFNYDTTNSEIDFDVVRTSQTPNCMMKDITSSTNGLGIALSTTNWRMRFKIYWDNWEDKGDITLWLGLCSFSRSEAINGSNSNDVRKPTGGDLIGLQFTNANLSNNCWNNLKFYYGENEDDTTRFGGDSVNHAVDLEVANTILASSNYNCNKPTDDTYYWCEIIRDGSTVTFNCSKTAYGLSDVCGASNSDAGKTTSGTATTTFGTTRPLKYFYVGKTGGTGSTAHIQGTISDLQIENTGSSSIDRGQLTDVQLGSRFEETDTRKMYHRGTVVTPSLSKTDCVGYYTLDETSGNPVNHVTTANGFADIPTQTIYYLAHGHDATGRHFVKKVGSAVSVIDADDWFALKGALTEAHTGGQVSALPSAWSGMWQGATGSINGHGWYAISFSTDTNSPVNGSTGATQNITGKHGKCFEFSGGNNEQVSLNGAMMADYYYPTQHSQTTHQADFAISCWINLSSNNTGYPSVISNYSGSNTSGFQFLLWGANTISFHTSTNAIHGSTVMSSGTWYHVVAMRESGYLKLYVNGSADGTPVANAHIIKAESDMVIGGKADGTAGFNGKIDDVSVWRRALTTSEISSLHSTGTVLTTGTSATSWIEEGT